MALVVNKSPAKISAALDGVMYDFVPGALTSVDEEAWAGLKEIRLIQRSLDNGVLVVGRQAQQVASDAKKETAEQVQADKLRKAQENGAPIEAATGAATASNTSSGVADDAGSDSDESGDDDSDEDLLD